MIAWTKPYVPTTPQEFFFMSDHERAVHIIDYNYIKHFHKRKG